MSSCPRSCSLPTSFPTNILKFGVFDVKEEGEEDMHEKIREGESSRDAANNVQRGSPLSPPSLLFFFLPRIKSETLPASSEVQKVDARLGDPRFVF